ncbi:50S ribosomal protein L23, partial [Candidatus Poribacteria bacterium]|nr:50S ribosomal protein L23 [Candidatus Poribacteria bacterium]
MKDKYQVILRPHITEKSTLLREDNKYSFVVSRGATKKD